MRQAVILVGGRGTRLGRLAQQTPKPLMPVAGDKRFLDYLIENIARQGFSDILLLAGHLAGAVQQRYAGAEIRGAKVRVIVEPEPAGTAGALRQAANELDDIFLMTNGDTFFDTNCLALMLAPGDTCVMALRRVPDGARFGRVEVHGSRVIAFHEKDAAFRGEALISAGLYAMRKDVLSLITQTPCSIETEVFPKLAAAGVLKGVESDGYFIDIGLPETLDEARETLPRQARRGAVLFDRDGTLIRDDGYTHKPEALEWLPGAVEAIRRVNDAGRLAIVVTNQAGVARGYYDQSAVDRFHAHMQAELRAQGAHIDAFYSCPFHEAGIVREFAYANHPDRKPNPGMLRRAMVEWDISPELTFLVGDADSDVAAAAALGLEGAKAAPDNLLGMVEKKLQALKPKTSSSITQRLRQDAHSARTWLFDHALPLWWDAGFDGANRCFQEQLRLDGRPNPAPRRARVQARQTAVYARAGRLGWPGPWRDAVEAGAKVLLERALNPTGGTIHLIASGDSSADARRDLYDLAFVMFGLAEAASALGDRPDLIAAANALLQWADENWALAQGGFHEGEITPSPPRRQNPHMHAFEACLSLYEASGAHEHLARATTIADLFATRFFNAELGALPEYFDEHWRPLSGDEGAIVEPGHEFEWSWLLHRFQALGGRDCSALAERLRVHGEVYGVDPGTGLVYDEIYLDGRVRTRSSRLWPYTERLKANIVRFERTRDLTAAAAAVQAFEWVMRHCETPTPGLWRDRRDPAGVFDDGPAPASSLYHVMFGMHELIRVAEQI